MEQSDRELLIETRDFARDAKIDIVYLKEKVEVVRLALCAHCDEEKEKPVEQKRLSLDVAGRVAQWTSAVIAAAAILIAVLR